MVRDPDGDRRISGHGDVEGGLTVYDPAEDDALIDAVVQIIGRDLDDLGFQQIKYLRVAERQTSDNPDETGLTDIVIVDPEGQLVASRGLLIDVPVADGPALTVFAFDPAQTANLIEVKDSGGFVVWSVGPGGVTDYGGSTVSRRSIFTIGDGTSTEFDLEHGFANQWVDAIAIRTDPPHDKVDIEVECTDADNCRVIFPEAPFTDQFKILVLG